MSNFVKVAIVTGGNKGLGYEIVRGLCKKFDGIVYLTARNADNGTSAVEKLKKEGLNPKFYQLDIEDNNSIEKFANYIKQQHGGIDVLVNNAAICIRNDEGFSKAEEASKSIFCNFTAQINVCNALFPLLRSNARVVNMSSRLGFLSEIKNNDIKNKLRDPKSTIQDIIEIMNHYQESCANETYLKYGYPEMAYSMTKVGLNAITPIQQRNIDQDQTRTGIIVSAVTPGYCKTDMTRNAGVLSAEKGAQTPIFLCLLPENFDGPKGAFWAENELIEWQNS